MSTIFRNQRLAAKPNNPAQESSSLGNSFLLSIKQTKDFITCVVVINIEQIISSEQCNNSFVKRKMKDLNKEPKIK
jgi:hypothetical protein